MFKSTSVPALIEKISSTLLLALVVLTPILVVPYTRNLIVDTKVFFILFVAVVLMLGYAVKSLLARKWEVAVSPLTVPLALFGGAVAVSVFLGNRYPVEGLLGAGGVYIAAALVGILGASLVKGDHTEKVLRLSLVSGAVVSVLMILQHFGLGVSRLINQISEFNLPDTLLFNVTGSSFVAVQVLAVALVGLVAMLLNRKKLAVMDWALGAIIAAGLALGIWSILPGNVAAVSLTPLSASWTVMARSLETPQAALIGHGPAAYANLYALFKPLWTNGEAYWQFNFGTAFNTPLTLIVTLGILGLVAWAFLVTRVFKQLRHTSKSSRPLLLMLVATFVIQLLLPTNIVLLGLQIPLFVFWVVANRDHFSLVQFKAVKVRTYPAKIELIKRFFGKKDWFVRTTATIAIVAVLGLGYLVSRAYAAYFFMYKANVAFTQQDAVGVYDNQRKAIEANPYLDSFRREYASTNLQIAVALANRADISEEERQQVTQLIGQAVREGRAAALLDDRDVDNWLALAQVYRTLIGAADEAGTWAVNSLVNAAQLNPTNPLIRLQIGQLMLLDNKAQDAATFFSQAVQLKPDLPAGYYQLGLAFQALNQPANAKVAWEQALTLLPAGSEDYSMLQAQIQTLGEQIEEEGIETPEEVSQPNMTEQNVQQQESEIINPGQDAQL